jgi:hypothetical protein
MPLRKLTWYLSLSLLGNSAFAASEVGCALPVDFVDEPPPTVEGTEALVSHVEEIIIDRPLAAVMTGESRTAIERTLRKTRSLPGVVGTRMLAGTWGRPGARRITCLTDGGHTQEQVLINDRQGNVHHFRYEVWHYTTPKARPVAYAVGDFLETDLGDGRTRIRWTYSFRLRPNAFPGDLGALGRLIFRSFYLDTRYARFMRRALAARKAIAEQGR